MREMQMSFSGKIVKKQVLRKGENDL